MRWPLRLQVLVPFCGLTVLLLIVVSVVNAVVASRMVEERIYGIDGVDYAYVKTGTTGPTLNT